MTYMVLETHASYCVVVDEAGRFLKAANMGYVVGQTVQQVEAIKTREALAFNAKRTMTLAGGIAACFIVVLAVYLNSMILTPFASVYLSINPAVRLDVSKDNRVVSLEAVNEDGAALLEGYSGKRKELTVVSDELVDRAIAMGFLSDGGMVTIDIDAPDEVWFQDTGIALRQNLDQYLSERLSVTIEIKQYGQTQEPEERAESEEQAEPDRSSEASIAPPIAPSAPVSQIEESSATAPSSRRESSTPAAPPATSSSPPQRVSDDDSGYSGYASPSSRDDSRHEDSGDDSGYSSAESGRGDSSDDDSDYDNDDDERDSGSDYDDDRNDDDRDDDDRDDDDSDDDD